jgi:hypothetical protein
MCDRSALAAEAALDARARREAELKHFKERAEERAATRGGPSQVIARLLARELANEEPKNKKF